MKDYMDLEKLEVVKNRNGFIAALDQSGGSTPKSLEYYGIKPEEYSSEEEMFDLVHKMRTRIMTSPAFTSGYILGSILFYKTMESKVNDKFTADYLWEDKRIVSFLKVDKGLADEEDSVKLMKEIPDLEEQLAEARNKHIFGTKMRSVIYGANREGIRKVIKQQFEFAKIICDNGLVPIIEPEVDINITDKAEAESILKECVIDELNNWDKNDLIMFKFTIPTEDNLYLDFYNYECVVRVLALSGGYTKDKACELLKKNDKMIASFSRALAENIFVYQTDDEFNEALLNSVKQIYDASL